MVWDFQIFENFQKFSIFENFQKFEFLLFKKGSYFGHFWSGPKFQEISGLGFAGLLEGFYARSADKPRILKNRPVVWASGQILMDLGNLVNFGQIWGLGARRAERARVSGDLRRNPDPIGSPGPKLVPWVILV